MTRIWIAAMASAILVGQAQAGGRCIQPYAPVVKINTSTNMRDLAALHDDVQAFIAASDIFQGCLLAQGAESDPRIDANQAEKIRIGQEFNEALRVVRKRVHLN